jgi:hypothetical protein
MLNKISKFGLVSLLLACFIGNAQAQMFGENIQLVHWSSTGEGQKALIFPYKSSETKRVFKLTPAPGESIVELKTSYQGNSSWTYRNAEGNLGQLEALNTLSNAFKHTYLDDEDNIQTEIYGLPFKYEEETLGEDQIILVHAGEESYLYWQPLDSKQEGQIMFADSKEEDKFQSNVVLFSKGDYIIDNPNPKKNTSVTLSFVDRNTIEIIEEGKKRVFKTK